MSIKRVFTLIVAAVSIAVVAFAVQGAFATGGNFYQETRRLAEQGHAGAGEGGAWNPIQRFDLELGTSKALNPVQRFDTELGPKQVLNPVQRFDTELGPNQVLNPVQRFDLELGPTAVPTSEGRFDNE